MTHFRDLGLAEPLLRALDAEGYETPTSIQTQAIPIVLEGHDLVGLAQTGTGKTAAFALPLLQRLAADRRHAGERSCRALVLAPTRELASQIADSFRAYGRFMGLSCTVVFGGASMEKQRNALRRGVDILVATPGRLLDHVGQRTLRLDRVEALVLDEADHMLDMGFIHALNRIAELVPEKRQTLFFSATMPPAIRELANRFISNPKQVEVAPVSSTAERVKQFVVHIEQNKKQDLLRDLVDDETFTRALVFTRTKHGADRVARRLADTSIDCEVIHGNRSQGQRVRALELFKSGRVRLLIATEIAARGIDVDDVSHVINFDLPNVPEQYVHRIGRTARAGQAGIAISFCAPDEREYLRDIERLIAQKVEVLETDHSLPTPAPHERGPRPKPPGQKQRRPQRAPRPQGSFDRGHQNERPARAERGPQQERPAQQERSAHRDRPAQHERPARHERSHQSDRPQQKERPARAERPAHAGDRPPKRDHQGKPAHARPNDRNRSAARGKVKDKPWSNSPR